MYSYVEIYFMRRSLRPNDSRDILRVGLHKSTSSANEKQVGVKDVVDKTPELLICLRVTQRMVSPQPLHKKWGLSDSLRRFFNHLTSTVKTTCDYTLLVVDINTLKSAFRPFLFFIIVFASLSMRWLS